MEDRLPRAPAHPAAPPTHTLRPLPPLLPFLVSPCPDPYPPHHSTHIPQRSSSTLSPPPHPPSPTFSPHPTTLLGFSTCPQLRLTTAPPLLPVGSPGHAPRHAGLRYARVGSPGASQLPAPTDPGVTVSRHRALLTSRQYARTHFQWANRPGSRSCSPVHHRLNRL